ncbi:MAG: hypothetical protein O7E54_11785 [Planctomycetota bacterium]|jgi:hypothetical protein|nr:hypothetical protein [Planctomycetota bacterium]
MKPPHACLHLNNKAYFLLPSPDEEAEMDRELQTPFWCGRTLEAIGPDEGDVHDGCCKPGRPCFEPEVKL